MMISVQDLLKMRKCRGDRGRPEGYERVKSEHPVLKHYFLDAQLVNRVQRVWRAIEPEDLPLVDLMERHGHLTHQCDEYDTYTYDNCCGYQGITFQDRLFRMQKEWARLVPEDPPRVVLDHNKHDVLKEDSQE